MTFLLVFRAVIFLCTVYWRQRHTASAYLSSWCSGTPGTVGCAAGEDEAGCRVREQRSAAPEDCCCSSCSHSCRGIRHIRGRPADPDHPHWTDSQWSRLSGGQYCEGPLGSPYWNKKRDDLSRSNNLHLMSLQLQGYQSAFNDSVQGISTGLNLA